MGYLKERIKHAVRFRHKRGYGVHSPFMFNLILTGIFVIWVEKLTRSAYNLEQAGKAKAVN